MSEGESDSMSEGDGFAQLSKGENPEESADEANPAAGKVVKAKPETEGKAAGKKADKAAEKPDKPAKKEKTAD